MAVRNTKIGGTDYKIGEYWNAADRNDTFDLIVDIVDAGNS